MPAKLLGCIAFLHPEGYARQASGLAWCWPGVGRRPLDTDPPCPPSAGSAGNAGSAGKYGGLGRLRRRCSRSLVAWPPSAAPRRGQRRGEAKLRRWRWPMAIRRLARRKGLCEPALPAEPAEGGQGGFGGRSMRVRRPGDQAIRKLAWSPSAAELCSYREILFTLCGIISLTLYL
jgi:hypothetical protein